MALQKEKRSGLSSLLASLTGRRMRRQANSWVYTLAVIGILVLINALASRYSWRFDMTRNQQFTLAPQTREVLANLPGKVTVIGFYANNEMESGMGSYMAGLLKEYAHHSRGKLSWKIVDPATAPSLVREYEIPTSAVTVVAYGEKREMLDQWDLMGSFDPETGRPRINGEQALTNAIIRVTAAHTPKAYFLTGYETAELRALRRHMQEENYQWAELNLIEEQAIPEDAELLVLAGPRRDLTGEEIQRIDEWLLRTGGRLLLMVDPGHDLPNLAGWLQGWGITLRDDVVIDAGRHYGYDPAAVVPLYGTHPITNKVDSADLAMVLPRARSMAVEETPREGLKLEELLTSSRESWGETDLTAPPERGEQDPAGPLTLAVAATREQEGRPEARMVVVGSSGFATDDVLQIQGNLDFVMNAMAWLVDKGESVTIRAKEVIQEPLFLTAQTATGILVATVVVVPLALLVMGGAIWYRRRHL